jgi:hypothetical protein
MMSKRFFAMILLPLVLMSNLNWHKDMSQIQGEQYLKAAGHFMTGEFSRKLYNISNPLQLNGYPISAVFQDQTTNKLVQSFQNMRLKWRSELPAGPIILSANTGKKYFHYMQGNPIRLRQESGSKTVNGTVNLKVHAYPIKAVTSRNGTQTIFVIVQDQRLLPVKNAQVTITLKMPAGEEIRHIVPVLTDEKGVTKYTFPFNSKNVGIVQVTVVANSNNLEARTITSFRVWW